MSSIDVSEPDADDDVSLWIENLRGKDEEAIGRLWRRYNQRLSAEARKQLGRTPQRHVDEEDVAASVFSSLCRGAANGRFNALANRGELWRLLVVLTRCKVIDRKRRLKRERHGGGKVSGESIFFGGMAAEDAKGFDGLKGKEESPQTQAIVNEECQRLMELLRDDVLRMIVTYRVEGFSNEEIADKLQISTRSVERKFRLIRSLWLKELPGAIREPE